MNEKQLTKDEIQQLFQFVEKKGIKFYDIQLEIVDHFASEIEQTWDDFPLDWTFEQKILEVYYNQIGKGGFHTIQLAKGKAFEKWFNTHSINYVKSFFTWPKIGISFLLIFLVYSLISTADDPLMYGQKLMNHTLILPCLLVSSISLIWQFIGRKYKYSNMITLSVMSLVMPHGFIYLASEPIKWMNLGATISAIIISIFYVVFLYFIIAILLAFKKCYEDYRLQFPKLT